MKGGLERHRGKKTAVMHGEHRTLVLGDRSNSYHRTLQMQPPKGLM